MTAPYYDGVHVPDEDVPGISRGRDRQVVMPLDVRVHGYSHSCITAVAYLSIAGNDGLVASQARQVQLVNLNCAGQWPSGAWFRLTQWIQVPWRGALAPSPICRMELRTGDVGISTVSESARTAPNRIAPMRTGSYWLRIDRTCR